MKKQQKNKKKFQLRLRRITGGWAVMALGLARTQGVSTADSKATSCYRDRIRQHEIG